MQHLFKKIKIFHQNIQEINNFLCRLNDSHSPIILLFFTLEMVSIVTPVLCSACENLCVALNCVCIHLIHNISSFEIMIFCRDALCYDDYITMNSVVIYFISVKYELREKYMYKHLSEIPNFNPKYSATVIY